MLMLCSRHDTLGRMLAGSVPLSICTTIVRPLEHWHTEVAGTFPLFVCIIPHKWKLGLSQIPLVTVVQAWVRGDFPRFAITVFGVAAGRKPCEYVDLQVTALLYEAGNIWRGSSLQERRK
jgi:hypothetical protein